MVLCFEPVCKHKPRTSCNYSTSESMSGRHQRTKVTPQLFPRPWWTRSYHRESRNSSSEPAGFSLWALACYEDSIHIRALSGGQMGTVTAREEHPRGPSQASTTDRVGTVATAASAVGLQPIDSLTKVTVVAAWLTEIKC